MELETPTAPADPLANLNGTLMQLSQVRISALDRGFLFGDAVYEVLRVYGGRPWLADEHFARLRQSLESLRIVNVDAASIRRRVAETLAKSGVREGMVYIQVTRGAAPRKHAFPKDATPLELIYVQEFRDPYVALRESGAAAVTYPDIRWRRCDIKSTNLLGNVLAQQAAVEAGAEEALLYLPDGTLTEGSHTNLFGVIGGKLVTRPTSNNILPGITRSLVLKLAASAGVAVEERNLQRDRLAEVPELFISGTTSEVMPIVTVDGQQLGDGRPGPVTRRIQEAYAEAVRSFVLKT
jgi:D-alanine transaminase